MLMCFDSPVGTEAHQYFEVEVIFFCLDLFAQPGLQRIRERDDDDIFFSQDGRNLLSDYPMALPVMDRTIRTF